jgi:hypothetical protein
MGSCANGDIEMAEWWGRALFWMATIIAGLIVAWVVWSYVYGEPIIQIVPLLFAVGIWLLGLACRYGLARR